MQIFSQSRGDGRFKATINRFFNTKLAVQPISEPRRVAREMPVGLLRVLGTEQRVEQEFRQQFKATAQAKPTPNFAQDFGEVS